jgi:hypothetical protein
MPEETVPETAAVPKKNKGGRPRKHAVAPAPKLEPTAKPLADSPAVLQLQNDIVSLVRRRDAVSEEIAVKSTAAFMAQAELQGTQSKLTLLDQEVQYRMRVIQQMKGEVPMASYGPPAGTLFTMPPTASTYGAPVVSSAPTMPDDGVNRGRATRSML